MTVEALTPGRESVSPARLIAALLASLGLLVGASVAVAPAAHAATSSVSGTITGADDELITSGSVSLYRLHDDGHLVFAGQRTLSAPGTYTFNGLAPATYTIAVSAWSGNYHWQYLGGSSESAGAGTFVLAEGQALVIDIKLIPGGSVSGKVAFPDGSPAKFAWVDLLRWDDEYHYWDWYDDNDTDDEGVVEFHGMPPGTYTTYFGGGDGYVGGYLGGVFDAKQAQSFTVRSGETTTIAMTLQRGGVVKGEVARSDGSPATSGRVRLWRLYEDAWRTVENWYEGSESLTDGTYEFDRLEPGRYAVGFERVPGHPDQFIGGVDGLGGATLFTVELGKTTTVPRYQLVKKPRTGASTTLLALSHDERAYGGVTTATVTVKGSYTTPTGSVEILVDGKRAVTGELTNGGAVLTLPRDLAAGTYRVQARFLADGDNTGSASSVEPLWIRKAAPKVTAKLAKKKVKAKKRGTVRVTASAPGVTVSGKVLVKKGKKTLRTKALNKKGKAKLKLPKLARGKHKLRVVLQADRNFESAQSKNLTLTVKKAKPKKAKPKKAKKRTR